MECSGVHGYCDCSRTHHHHHHGLLNPSSFFSHTSSSPSSSSSAHDPTSSVESSGIGNQRLIVDTISALFVKLIATILACIFALVGSFIGAFTGALLGRTTESGFFRGAGIGAISGAVFTVEIFESCLSCWHSDQSGIWNVMIEINLIPGLLNGRLVREQVGPAMLSAVESQISALDTSFDEVHDIFETGEAKGMSRDSIKRLPKMKIKPENNITDSSGERICCSVCLQEFQEGESARCLPHCQHMFHMPCIDSWLTRHASCPLCRRDL